jgi:glycosyltransferase involved in cell wall biosynthesis
VPVGDAKALREAIEELINNHELYGRVLSNAFESVSNRYTFDRYTGNILDVAREIVGDAWCRNYGN